ncbi:hypothetical protein K438DRAFT_1768663 [Mycena galopus ATCC 62051]|nr:hypothetical protein K438DRAFT_1768663 [Mycena galopus ATCC 62051]
MVNGHPFKSNIGFNLVKEGLPSALKPLYMRSSWAFRGRSTVVMGAGVEAGWKFPENTLNAAEKKKEDNGSDGQEVSNGNKHTQLVTKYLKNWIPSTNGKSCRSQNPGKRKLPTMESITFGTLAWHVGWRIITRKTMASVLDIYKMRDQKEIGNELWPVAVNRAFLFQQVHGNFILSSGSPDLRGKEGSERRDFIACTDALIVVKVEVTRKGSRGARRAMLRRDFIACTDALIVVKVEVARKDFFSVSRTAAEHERRARCLSADSKLSRSTQRIKFFDKKHAGNATLPLFNLFWPHCVAMTDLPPLVLQR